MLIRQKGKLFVTVGLSWNHDTHTGWLVHAEIWLLCHAPAKQTIPWTMTLTAGPLLRQHRKSTGKRTTASFKMYVFRNRNQSDVVFQRWRKQFYASALFKNKTLWKYSWNFL